MRELLDSIEKLLINKSPFTNEKLVFIKKNQLNNLQQNINKDQLEQKYGGKINDFQQFWPPKLCSLTMNNTKNSLISLKESFHATKTQYSERKMIVNSKENAAENDKESNDNYEEILNFSLTEITKANQTDNKNKKLSLKELDKYYQEKSRRKSEAGFSVILYIIIINFIFLEKRYLIKEGSKYCCGTNIYCFDSSKKSPQNQESQCLLI